MTTFRNTHAFSGFSVDDIPAAKAFYAETLGLDVQDIDGGMLELRIAGGHPILVYPKGADHQPATFTILNFPVDEIDAAVAELEAAGVTFDKSNLDGGQGGPRIAWFTDPAGNVLSIGEFG